MQEVEKKANDDCVGHHVARGEAAVCTGIDIDMCVGAETADVNFDEVNDQRDR